MKEKEVSSKHTQDLKSSSKDHQEENKKKKTEKNELNTQPQKKKSGAEDKIEAWKGKMNKGEGKGNA